MKLFRLAALLMAQLISLPPVMAVELQSPVPLTTDDGATIRQQVEQNWNADPYQLQQCGKVFELRVALDPDGTVTKVDMPIDAETSDACRASMESAHRAILMASPLKMPSGSHISAIRLRFDPKNIPQ